MISSNPPQTAVVSTLADNRYERYQDAQEGHQHALKQYREIIHLHKIEPPDSLILEPNEYDTLILLLNADIIEHMKQHELGVAIEQSGIDYLKALSKKLIPFMRHKVELKVAGE